MSVRVTVTGHLTSDPQQRQTQNDNQYTTISVAGNERNRDEDETYFFGAMFFGKRGETVAGYHKGDLVSVSGHLHEYQGNGGNTYKQLNYAEIELLHRKQPLNNNQSNFNQQAPNNNNQQNQQFNNGQQPEWNGQQNNYQQREMNNGNDNLNLDDLPFS